MKQLILQIKKLSGNQKVYIVGGWLRDKLLKRPNRDLDLGVSGNAHALALNAAKSLKGRLVKLDEVNRIYRVVLKNNKYVDYLDFAKLKASDIRSDLRKRDFTVNSMAVILGEDDIIDPFKGKLDLKKGIIRITSADTFKDDPLRLMRAFRIASELQFKIEPKTAALIKKQSALIKKSAAERIRHELFRVLSCEKSIEWIRQMDKAGLLNVIFPEIIRMKSSARKFYFHPLGLWQHSLETLRSLEEILGSLKKLFPSHHGKITKHLDQQLSSGITRRSLLKVVALLHDVAKPACAKRVSNKMRFLGHEVKGSKMISDVLSRLHAGRKEIKIAKSLVAHHMRPINLGQSPVLTDRAVYRLFRDIGDNIPDLMLLTLSDCYSYRSLKTRKVAELSKQKQVVRKIISKYFTHKDIKHKPKIIDGHIIMKKFKLKPSPLIGRLLKIVEEAQAIGKINTIEDALKLTGINLTRIKKRDKI